MTQEASEPLPPQPTGGADVTDADGPQEPDLDVDGQAAEVDLQIAEGQG